MKPLVIILTYCAHESLSYGSTLVFKTLRIGFPNADVHVFDNDSCPEVATRIRQLSEENGAKFYPMEKIPYWEFYRKILNEREENPIVLVDPDVMFWESVENWDFGDALMAGRLIPAMQGNGTTCVPRLHPSFLWVHNPKKLALALNKLEAAHPYWRPIAPSTMHLDGRAIVFDTFAGAYQALFNQCTAFGKDQLDAYDHLFYGSHFPVIDAYQGGSVPDYLVFRESHALVKADGDIRYLKGMWKSQERVFQAARQGDPDGFSDRFKASCERFAGSEWYSLQSALRRTMEATIGG